MENQDKNNVYSEKEVLLKDLDTNKKSIKKIETFNQIIGISSFIAWVIFSSYILEDSEWLAFVWFWGGIAFASFLGFVIDNLTANSENTKKYKDNIRNIEKLLAKLEKEHQEITISNRQETDFILKNQEKHRTTKSSNGVIEIEPEIKYRTARKIDNWDEINKKRTETGNSGEKIVLLFEQNYLESINRKDLSEQVKHVSVEQGDGLGYDILSFFENGDNKYIEVKSTTGSIASAFNMSANELGFLRENIDKAFIYRISLSGTVPELLIKTATEVLESNIIPTSYVVKNK